MTRAELAKGSATFLVVIVAGLVSQIYLDRHLAAAENGKTTASSERAETSAPCVEKDGSWRHWPWSNVPALAPKCGEDR